MTDDNLVLKFLRDAKELMPQTRPIRRAAKMPFLIFMVGLTITIGSTGLLMGALTTALASFLMSRGMEMVPAMNVGFFAIGIVCLLGGMGILVAAIKAIEAALRGSE